MKISKQELDKEVGRLKDTINVIEEAIAAKNVNIEEYKRSIVKEKKFIWEHQNEFYDGDLRSAMNDEDFNVSLVNQNIAKVYKLYRSKETPYFSRIDFKRDGEVNSYYIGLTGVDRDYEPVVYDWRAPIANLYYNYGVGESKYEIDGRIVEGETTLKRQFEIKMGKIENVYDSETDIDSRDELLVSVLENNTSEQMKNIVHTIQKEQNEIIRYGGTSNLIVEGVAGSGKTSVALHRIAYLLYNQKGLTNKNVLILSPNSIFSNYISNVLPELGEENVMTTTFDDFATNFIKGVKVESIMKFVERHYEVGSKVNEQQKEQNPIRYKDKLDNFLNEYFDSLKFTKKFGLKTTFISSAELNEIKSHVPEKLGVHDKFNYISEKVCGYFKLDEVRNSSKFREKIMEVLGVEKNPLKLYERFSNKKIEDTVPYEDVFAILYLYFEIWGYPTFGHIKVVVIDEAQDYSMWQFEFLKRIFTQAVFTILGDKNQRVNPYIRYNSMEEIAEVFKNSKYKKLSNTYRSSKEIIEYSNKILDLSGINSIRPSNGVEVVSKQSDNLESDIREELEKFHEMGYKRVAVVTKTASETSSLKAAVGTDATFIPVYLAKGLEYDAVIVATTKENAYKDEEMSLFYVAVTRALHALVVLNQREV